jgi:hypothetical protein
MIGPAGVWILMPFVERPTFTESRWKIAVDSGKTISVFGQEGQPPDLDAEHHIAVLRKFLEKRSDGGIVPDIQAMMVFTNNEVELDPGVVVDGMKLK